MRATFAYERRGSWVTSLVLVATIVLVAGLVLEGRGLHRVVPLLAGFIVFTAWAGRLTRWRNLLAALFLVILFIPIKRYELPGSLPFQLEPYRVIVAGLALVWILSMLVDRRVRLRRTSFDAPLMLILFTTLLSDVVNPERVNELSSDVLKAQTFFVSFFVVFYIVVSLVQTRGDVSFFVRLLAGGGAVIALCAIVERRTGFNAFNHLHSIFPVLTFEGAAEQFRSGRLRVLASAQHPIALSVLFVVLLPLVLYLARSVGRRWLLVAGLYVIAIFSTASRTGIVGLLILGIVYLALQPRSVLRAWPLALPVIIAIHFVAPGAIGTIRESLNPTALIAEQAAVTVGNDAYASGRITDIGPSLAEWSQQPLSGQGFATRVVTGPNANARVLDDQWLGTLLETGYLGFLAWIWLFAYVILRLGRAARKEGDSDDGWLLTGFAAAMASFAVTMAFYDTFSFIQNAFVCFILLGLVAAFLNIRADEAINTLIPESANNRTREIEPRRPALLANWKPHRLS
ncbi:MAG: O-antigen ligase family protein [Dehalococcoidia bacterium]|nr:O-antigen ligase family protein [Dehalococcoidia bacterium]